MITQKSQHLLRSVMCGITNCMKATSFQMKHFQRYKELLKKTRPEIANMICNNAGIELMNVDSKSTKYIIKEFPAIDTPVLSVHNS